MSTISERRRTMASEFRINDLIDAINDVLATARRPIALHEPRFGQRESVLVQDCLDSGWVSSAGQYVTRFENEVVAFVGGGYAVAVVNGTAALQVCLQLAGVRPGDEVLVPALTFVATANAVSYCRATPHFVDSDETTLGIDPSSLQAYLESIAETRDGVCHNRLTGRPIRVLLPMHTVGHPVDLDPLLALCQRFGMTMVEDAAESLGSFYRGRHTGRFGRLAALSFNGNKIITTGGGGMILTEDEALANRARHLTTTAKLPHRWTYEHDEIGYNYRMPNLNAALGCGQLQRLPDYLARKRALADRYRDALKNISGVRFADEPPSSTSNYWLNTIVLDADFGGYRDEILRMSHEQDILTRPLWTPMHQLPAYSHCPRMELAIADSLFQRVIHLPSSPFLYA